MSKPSEDTVTTIISDLLKDHEALNIQTFGIWETPKGLRKPDILISNSAKYPLEAKIKDNDVFLDIGKIQNDYFEYHEILDVGGAFVIQYPENLFKRYSGKELESKIPYYDFKLFIMFPPGDQRQFEIVSGRYKDIIQTIHDVVTYKRKNTELTVPDVTEVLIKSAFYLDSSLRDVDFRKLIKKMGGIELFEDLLAIKVTSQERKAIRVATSFFIIIQILFYHVVSCYRAQELLKLEKIESLRTLKQDYFEKIQDINYKPIFSIDIISELPNSAIAHINSIITVIKGLKPENVRGDLIGTIFHDLIPFEIRKRVAAYYTNIATTDFLAELTIEKEDDNVADLACGSGGLLVAAYRKKKQLCLQSKDLNFNEEIHKKYVSSDLLGIDIMPFATAIACCNVSLQSPQFKTNKVNIGLWDSTDLEPGNAIPEFASLDFIYRGQKTIPSYFVQQKQVKRTVDLTDEKILDNMIHLTKTDVILMNPPFTRQERLSQLYKDRIETRLRKYKDYYNSSMGLHGVFILIGDKFLTEKGKMGLVLPASVLARKSFSDLRIFIGKNYIIELIIFNTSKINFSESTSWREILLIIKKEKPENNNIKVCRLLEYSDSSKEVTKLAKMISKDKSSEKYELTYFDQEKFKKMDDWSSIIIKSPKMHNFYENIKNQIEIHPLSEVSDCYEIDLRHFKTDSKLNCFVQSDKKLGTNQLKEKLIYYGFKCKSVDIIDPSRIDEEWREEELYKTHLKVKHVNINGSEFKIPTDSVNRGLRTTFNIQTMDINEISDFIVIKAFPEYKETYLRYVMNTQKINKFKSSEFGSVNDNLQKRKSHMVLNRRLYLATDSSSYVAYYSDYPFVAVDTWGFYELNKDEAKVLTLWLNSTFGIIQLLMVGVAIEGNWMKIHKYMTEDIFVPKFTVFKKSIDKVNDLFDIVSHKAVPSFVTQLEELSQVRKQIDLFFIDMLDLKTKIGFQNSDDYLNSLYEETLNELKALCPSDFNEN